MLPVHILLDVSDSMFLESPPRANAGRVRQLGEGLVTLGWIDPGDTVYVNVPLGLIDTDSRGAVWNYRMLLEERSEGVHNPNYIGGVLTATQTYVTSQLGN